MALIIPNPERESRAFLDALNDGTVVPADVSCEYQFPEDSQRDEENRADDEHLRVVWGGRCPVCAKLDPRDPHNLMWKYVQKARLQIEEGAPDEHVFSDFAERYNEMSDSIARNRLIAEAALPPLPPTPNNEAVPPPGSSDSEDAYASTPREYAATPSPTPSLTPTPTPTEYSHFQRPMVILSRGQEIDGGYPNSIPRSQDESVSRPPTRRTRTTTSLTASVVRHHFRVCRGMSGPLSWFDETVDHMKRELHVLQNRGIWCERDGRPVIDPVMNTQRLRLVRSISDLILRREDLKNRITRHKS